MNHTIVLVLHLHVGPSLLCHGYLTLTLFDMHSDFWSSTTLQYRPAICSLQVPDSITWIVLCPHDLLTIPYSMALLIRLLRCLYQPRCYRQAKVVGYGEMDLTVHWTTWVIVRQIETIREESDIFFGWPTRRKRYYGRNERRSVRIVVLSSQEETRSSFGKSKLTVSDASCLVIDVSMAPHSRFTPKGPSARMIDNVTMVDHVSEMGRCDFRITLSNFGVACIRKLVYICEVFLFTADEFRP